MSGSAKKKLIQKTLPFALKNDKNLVPTPSKPTENLSPNVVALSRKRKTSVEVDNVKPKKRVTEANESDSVSDVIELVYSDEEADKQANDKSSHEESEKTPKSFDNVLHIKLPSCSKLKKKNIMDIKTQKAIDEEDHEREDSVVYLDQDELIGISRKTRKAKSEKKKKKKNDEENKNNNKDASANADPIKTNLNLSLSGDGEEIQEINSDAIGHNTTKIEEGGAGSSPCDQQSVINILEAMEVDNAIEVFECTNEKFLCGSKSDNDSLSKMVENAGAKSIPADDSINEELIGMLSDDSDSSPKNKTSLNDCKTPSSSKIDIRNLTPKQLALREKQNQRRAEKELQRQQERDLKEQQRLKEKENRDEAKRKEKEEKEDTRKKEKEERDKKRIIEQEKKDEEKRLKEEERKVLCLELEIVQ